MAYRLFIAETAYRSLEVIEDYQTALHGVAEAQKVADNLLSLSAKEIAESPLRYGYNHMATDKGLRLRQWYDKEQKHRVLYEITENNEVYVLLYVSVKQDLEQLLYQLLISF
ncbi:type II toxin-antitoxin system RelE/ParE family toxin [Budviciaceae bacterium CWB-B4]|uniref:Type II toxin-antitoxin system RelE/ParE family toxin n=1 Tax=Limnobaculum xujianqingii TaxID=2738837 RepID=A0A9D7AL53_9GAMM|nr:type II toxin-antitoxin system RelE/ParE family toxin [Limnobaculum xujianqingii]MBK5074710.1 type II toxin-antitoxin system RelE/ParE family toxin [Limnobaculum xujianqingii]MBK5177958.1 type II toxin-antitoxin system RelE/ParE family toxin [Limnobaculum xujianqingii]